MPDDDERLRRLSLALPRHLDFVAGEPAEHVAALGEAQREEDFDACLSDLVDAIIRDEIDETERESQGRLRSHEDDLDEFDLRRRC